MDAKETVRYLPNQFRECADEDGAIQKYKVPIHEPSFQAGIREVVEWMSKNRKAFQPSNYGTEYYVSYNEWQDKLKEWEIK